MANMRDVTRSRMARKVLVTVSAGLLAALVAVLLFEAAAWVAQLIMSAWWL